MGVIRPEITRRLHSHAVVMAASKDNPYKLSVKQVYNNRKKQYIKGNIKIEK